MRLADASTVGTLIYLKEEQTRAHVAVDEVDGWLVEAAIRSLPNFDKRKIMKYWHAYGYPEHWFRTKLMLRASAVRLVMARAETNLRLLLKS